MALSPDRTPQTHWLSHQHHSLVVHWERLVIGSAPRGPTPDRPSVFGSTHSGRSCPYQLPVLGCHALPRFPLIGHFSKALPSLSLDPPLRDPSPFLSSLTGSAPAVLIGPLVGPAFYRARLFQSRRPSLAPPPAPRGLTGALRQSVTHADSQGPATSFEHRQVAGATGEGDTAGAASAPALLLYSEL